MDDFKEQLKEIFQTKIDEFRNNKVRIGLLVACLFAAMIVAVVDAINRGETIDLEPAKVAQVEEPAKDISSTHKTVSVSSEKVKAVIGANAEEIFVYDPFKRPTPNKVEVPAQVEEKILPPIEPIIIPPVIEEPKPEPPKVEFILRGTALGETKTALIEKILDGKVETLFLQVGDKLNDKIIVDITADAIKLDDETFLYAD